jgi:polar amino acid transport system permease protein
LTLTLGVIAYFTEIIRAGIGSIHKGQWEAADALGLSNLIKWKRIILPQAIRIVLPPLTSLVIGVFKATAILSILSVNELMDIGNKISNFTFKPVEIITTVAVIYFVTGTSMSKIGNIIENRYTLKD